MIKKSIFAAIFIVSLSGLAFGASFDPSLNWLTIKSKHFHIHFAEGMEDCAELSAKYLEEAHEKLTKKFGWAPWGYTEILLVDNNDSANATTSTLPYNWMLLRMAAPDPDSILAYYDNWLRTVILHEYTHILHIDRTGGIVRLPRLLIGKMISPNGTVPGWMREGIATYFETTETEGGRGSAAYSEMMLRTAVLENKFPKIDEADGLSWKWPSYQAMYIYGVKFLQYLADIYGEEKLMKFHKRMGSTLLFFDVDHQARNVFVDVEYISVKRHNRYARIKKPGTKGGVTFPLLWKEWEQKLVQKYAEEKRALETEGLTEFAKVAGGETKLSNPAISPDGRYLAYARARVKAPNEIRLIDLSTGIDSVIIKGPDATSISFSPDSKSIAYSALGVWKKYNLFSDLYLYDIESRKITRLTKGARASDPAFSPDGKKIVFVKQSAGRSWLAVYDVGGKKVEDLERSAVSGQQSALFTQFSAPAWSPDGKWIAMSSWQSTVIPPNPPLEKGGEGGFDRFSQPAWSPDGKYIAVSLWRSGRWDIYLAEVRDSGFGARDLIQLTNDFAIDSHPIWSPDGKSLYFASDKSGISNIYKIVFAGSRVWGSGLPGHTGTHTRGNAVSVRMTNVLTGAFQPAISPDGKTLYVQYYNGKGFDIRKTVVSRQSLVVSKEETTNDQRPTTNDQVSRGDPLWSPDKGGDRAPPLLTTNDRRPTTKYSPFSRSLFLPRFTIPALAFQDNALFFDIFTGSTDPLRRHIWRAGANYRSDISKYFGYYFNYTYNRHTPIFSVGINEYPVKFGNITFVHADGSAKTVKLYEGRRKLFSSAIYPFGMQALSLAYFWEDRRSLSDITTAEANVLNLGKFAGFSTTYSYGQTERYAASISPEKGRRLKANFTVTDSVLNSNEKNEQRIFAGDYREYISMPWQNHVVALRAGGGMTWGDRLVQGTFTLGGDLGEGTLGGGASLFYFPLRGLLVANFSGTRAMLVSSEYRMPLISPQRGLSTRPYYLKNIHLAPFLDYGNIWSAATDTWGEGKYFFNNFMLGTGIELRGDFVIGHGLPVTGRLGYGIIVLNRDRVATATAPVFKSPVKYGVMILQLGTAF